MTANTLIALLVMILTIYAVRALPFLFLRKEITSPFIRSFLYYVPFVTLAVMTFPAMVTATDSIWSGIIALAAAAAAALIGGDLFTVACVACAAVFVSELLIL